MSSRTEAEQILICRLVETEEEARRQTEAIFTFEEAGMCRRTIMSRAMNLNITAPFAFIGSFYIFLVGSKFLLAVLVSRSKYFLKGTLYIYTMRLLGFALCILALLLFRDGLILLGIITIN